MVGDNEWTRRRALGAGGLLGLAGLGSGLIAGCGDSDPGRASVTASTSVARSTGPRLIMIIRHAEKPDGSGTPYGITADGVRDDESLTTRGWGRAGALAALFDPAVGGLRAGLAVPSAVLATNPGADGSKRPTQTVSEVAARIGVDVDSTLTKSDASGVARWATAQPGPVLICWQHEQIPSIARHIGAHVPSSWPDARFDLVWVLRPVDARTWSLTQVPQLLLAGDSAQPIGD